MSGKIPDSGVAFYVHESSADLCVAMAIHRTGLNPLPLGWGDPMWDDSVTQCVGTIERVEQVMRVTPDTWLYKVSYRPGIGTKHGYFAALRYCGAVEARVEDTGRDTSLPAKQLAVTA